MIHRVLTFPHYSSAHTPNSTLEISNAIQKGTLDLLNQIESSRESQTQQKDLFKWVCCCSVLSYVWPFATPWTAAHQSPLSFTISRSLFKLRSIELVVPSKHLILCCCLLLLPSIFPSKRAFSSESALCLKWPK